MKNKILVIDDDVLSLQITRDSLEYADYDVVTAKDVTEAIAKLRSEKIDLVILDLILPGTDGFGFLDICKNDSELKKIPVIAFTGRDSIEDVEKLKRRGVLACLIKDKTPPWHLENVVGLILEQKQKK